jgi:pimeloyl-ACP methyl ester carboxylesterase
VTLGTNFAWTPEKAARDATRLDAAAIRAKVPRFAAALEARHAGAGGWESVLEGTASLLRGLGAAPPLHATALARVRARALLAVGDGDDTVSEAETREYAALIPGAVAVVLPATPHPIEKVAPGLVLDLVRRVSAG